jgi:hypothetical protein
MLAHRLANPVGATTVILLLSFGSTSVVAGARNEECYTVPEVYRIDL